MRCSSCNSECTCQATCSCPSANCYCVPCVEIRKMKCSFCGKHYIQTVISSEQMPECSCFTTSSINPVPNQSISSNRRDNNTSSNSNFQDELTSATVSLDSSHPNVEVESTHAQALDTETGESSMSDISDCRVTGNNWAEQMDYLPIIPAEETELAAEETELAAEETELAAEETELAAEETELAAEETDPLNLSDILDDYPTSPYDPVNSLTRVQYYRSILTENIKSEYSAASTSRSETGGAKKNTSLKQTKKVSNSSTGRTVSRAPQVPFSGMVAAKQSFNTPFPDYDKEARLGVPSEFGQSASIRQQFVIHPVISDPNVKPPFYTDSATQRHQAQFSESVQTKPQTKPAFSKGSNKKPGIPCTPASKYSISKGVLPRVSGVLTRTDERIVDWLKKMTTAPNPPDDSIHREHSSSSSPSQVKLTKNDSELQNETKSKDTKSSEQQSAAVASDESSSSFACRKATAHKEEACAIDTSTADDSENKNIEHTTNLEEAIVSFTGAIDDLRTRLEEIVNIEETKETVSDETSKTS